MWNTTCKRNHHSFSWDCSDSNKCHIHLCTIQHLKVKKYITVNFGLLLWINQWHHTTIVQTIWFHEVNYHEFVLNVLSGIGNWKIIPLCVAYSVPIWSQNELIVCLCQLYCPSEISWLKFWLKNQCLIILRLWNIERKYIHPMIFGIEILTKRRIK